ncbi:MAG: hypothetical protein ACLR56_02760 [Oscillospiraceae bacterium]
MMKRMYPQAVFCLSIPMERKLRNGEVKMKNPLRKKKCTKAQLRNCAEAYTFMAPFIIGVAIFLAFPLLFP